MSIHRRDMLKIMSAGAAGTVLPAGVFAVPALAAPQAGNAAEVTRRAVAGERTVSLSGPWRFRTDADRTGESQGFTGRTYDHDGWATLTVPGNWDVHDEYAHYRGVAWYRRRVDSPPRGTGEVVRLRFEAAYHHAKVWFNGRFLGEHRGGYTPFEFDVSGLLDDTDGNTVAVAVDNTYSIGAWWPWGGLSRSVSFVVNDAVRVERQHVVTQADLDSGTTRLRTWVTVSNASAQPQQVNLTGAVSGPGGAALPGVAVATATLTVPALSSAEASLVTVLPAGSYRLWQLDDPALYRWTTSVTSTSGSLVHGLADRFGVRVVEVRDTRLLLNGEPVRLNGYNRVGDDRVEGATEPVHLIRRDMDRMKASGCNLTRIHHVAQSPELLDYADEIGMLLIEEVPVWGSGNPLDPQDPVVRGELREMIRRDYNHPSIIAWSMANEIRGATAAGRTFVRTLIDYVRQELDSTRLLTYVSNSFRGAATGADEALQYTDFACINLYGNFAGNADYVHQLYPDKPIFVSEFSSDPFSFPVSREDPDFETTSAAAAVAFRGRPWLIGSSHWTFNDYRSNYRGTSVNEVRGWGTQNVWGQLKRAYAQMQAVNAPVAGLAVTTSSGAGDRLSLLSVTPRGGPTGDAPGHVLRGYRLAWQVTDAGGRVLDGRLVDLPTIRPGDAELRVAVRWRDPGSAVGQRLTLLTPTGYEVASASADLRPPATPTIREVVGHGGAVRVVVTPVAGATGYRATATAGGTVSTSRVTTGTAIDLTGLSNGVGHQVTVVAINGAGASAPSGPVTGTPVDLLAPPRLQDVVPIDAGAVLGYVVVAGATGYQVEVRAGDTVVRDYVTTLRGSTRISGLAPDVEHTVRVRARTDSAVGAWSERRTVTPQSPSARATPQVHGFLAGPAAVGVRITPGRYTERHDLRILGDGGATVRVIEAAAVDLLPLTGLAPNREYRLAVRSGSAKGWSAPVTVTTRTRPAAATAPPSGTPVVSSAEAAGRTTLTWTGVAGADGYVLTVEGCGAPVEQAELTTDTRFDLGPTGAVAGNAYRVSAVNAAGAGPASATYTVPGTPGPREVTVTPAAVTADCSGVVPYTESGAWFASALPGVDGTPTRYSSETGATALWRPGLAAGGRYRVDIWVPASTSSTRAAEYLVTHDEGTATVPVDQRSQAADWVPLGTWSFTPGTASVLLRYSGGFARTNAVRLTPA